MALKKLSNKVSKHEQTVALAKSKSNTISSLVSKALSDNSISDSEFALIMAEKEKYNIMKQEIRQEFRKEEKKIDMFKLRAQIKSELMKKLTASTTQLGS